MGVVNTPLEREAESIFTDLGYTVTSDGGTLRATRKWRVVEVTPMTEPEEPPASGEFHCFVTWEEDVPAVERRLTGREPEYEWAIIGVRDDGEYVVSRRPS